MLTRVASEGPGKPDRVAVAKDETVLPGEQVFEGQVRRALNREFNQSVFGNPILASNLSQFAAQGIEFRHCQAAILGQYGSRSSGKVPLKVRDCTLFFLTIHAPSRLRCFTKGEAAKGPADVWSWDRRGFPAPWCCLQ